jgi:hypothetical protein
MIKLNDWGLTASEKSACAGGGVITVMGSEAVCVRAPEVPVNVAVEDPAAVPAGAVRVSVAAVPGVSVKVDGCAVTPVGRPASATWTLEENPFSAVASTEMAVVVPLAVKLRDAGVTLREKSAGVAAVTESEACVLAVWPLTVVANVTVAVIAGVEEAAVIVSGKATPGVTNSSIGETATPLGNPDIETVAAPPPVAAPSNREACWPAAPAIRWMLEGESVSVAGDMMPPVMVLLPPLQEARPPMINALATTEHTFLKNWWKGRVEWDMAAPRGSALAAG